jgi:sarcosine oxidase subunit gamma
MNSGAAKPIIRRSPLMARTPLKGKVELSERSDIGKVVLRGRADDSEFVGTVAEVLGESLPLVPNSTVAMADGAPAFWLGPSEWLVHSFGDGADLAAKLETALAGCFHQAVDVSDYYTVLRLAGPRARAILTRGCPLDFHPKVFTPGMAAQSRYAKAAVLIHLTDRRPVFDLQVRWSFADYLWDYFLAAAEPIDDDVVGPAG